MLLIVGWEQLIPRAVKSLFEPYKGCHQDVYLSGFNLLKRAEMQICSFRKFFLGNLAGYARAPQIPAKLFKLNLYFANGFHCVQLYEKRLLTLRPIRAYNSL